MYEILLLENNLNEKVMRHVNQLYPYKSDVDKELYPSNNSNSYDYFDDPISSAANVSPNDDDEVENGAASSMHSPILSESSRTYVFVPEQNESTPISLGPEANIDPPINEQSPAHVRPRRNIPKVNYRQFF